MGCGKFWGCKEFEGADARAIALALPDFGEVAENAGSASIAAPQALFR
jgi:hypothetical protein